MPQWRYTIRLADVFHNDELTFEQRRDAIVKRLRASRWFLDTDAQADLAEALDQLAEVEDVDEFDNVWNDVYDLADYDRAWIATF